MVIPAVPRHFRYLLILSIGKNYRTWNILLGSSRIDFFASLPDLVN